MTTFLKGVILNRGIINAARISVMKVNSHPFHSFSKFPSSTFLLNKRPPKISHFFPKLNLNPNLNPKSTPNLTPNLNSHYPGTTNQVRHSTTALSGNLSDWVKPTDESSSEPQGKLKGKNEAEGSGDILYKRKFDREQYRRPTHSNAIKWPKKKGIKKGKRPKKSPRNYRDNEQAYKELIYKWFLQAYPESLSRQEISGRLNAHPKKVKELLIKPLVEEGKIIKWGQRTVPYERYLPNIKAPEYYEVTGEEPPSMPDVDENELFRGRAKQKTTVQSYMSDAGVDALTSDDFDASPGFQDNWEEGGNLDDVAIEKLEKVSNVSSWDDLFDDEGVVDKVYENTAQNSENIKNTKNIDEYSENMDDMDNMGVSGNSRDVVNGGEIGEIGQFAQGGGLAEIEENEEEDEDEDADDYEEDETYEDLQASREASKMEALRSEADSSDDEDTSALTDVEEIDDPNTDLNQINAKMADNESEHTSQSYSDVTATSSSFQAASQDPESDSGSYKEAATDNEADSGSYKEADDNEDNNEGENEDAFDDLLESDEEAVPDRFVRKSKNVGNERTAEDDDGEFLSDASDVEDLSR